MSFGAPLGLWALAALAPLTAAYFLRRRQKPVRVSALFLWRTPLQRAEAGPRLERFTREVTFVLEVLAVLAATAFLADLRLGSTAPVKHLVVVVDGSLSMSARLSPTERVTDRARAAVLRALEEEGATSVTLVESSLKPRVLAGPRAPLPAALKALDAWRPQGADHDPKATLRWAMELAGPEEPVTFITDAWVPGATWDAAVEGVAVGSPLENLGFVAAQRKDQGPHTSVVVRVGNFTRAQASVGVTFRAAPASGNGPAVVRQQTLEVPREGTAVARATFENVGPVEVDLPADALPEDGHLVLLPAPEREVRLTFVGDLGAAEPAVRKFSQVAPGLTVRPDAPALSVGPAGSAAQLTLGATGSMHAFVGPFFSDRGNALFEDVDWDGVVWTAGDSPPGEPLVSAGEVALISEQDGALHFNVDLGRSNLARTPAWPILMANVLRRGRSSIPGFPQRHVALSQSIPVVTGGKAAFVLRGPAGEQALLGVGPALLPPAAVPGRYVLEADGTPVDELEVLPLDERESDLRERGSGLHRRALRSPVSLAGFSGARPVWPVLLLLAVLMADFTLGSWSRRPRGRAR